MRGIGFRLSDAHWSLLNEWVSVRSRTTEGITGADPGPFLIRKVNRNCPDYERYDKKHYDCLLISV